MKTWHEVVEEIQIKPEFANLVRDAYFSNDFVQNYRLYSSSPEALETIEKINKLSLGKASKVIDIGCGNGITSALFASHGLEVVSLEPDTSPLVGSGAIEKLAESLNISKNIKIVNAYAEDTGFDDETFDLAFARQSLHHAANLNSFCNEIARILKKGGYFFTVRDHVVYNEEDKKWFLDTHPLHRFYGGENAYTIQEYESAFKLAGFEIVEKMGHFDNVINYYPMTKKSILKSKVFIGIERLLPSLILKKLLRKVFRYSLLDETKVPGRHYAFIARKL